MSGGRATMRPMTDFLSKKTRSRVMSRIRSKDTKPELTLRKALFEAGIRGWRCHPRTVPGKPDIAFTRWRVAIFVDGCFWHGHPDYFTPGKSGGFRGLVRRVGRGEEGNKRRSRRRQFLALRCPRAPVAQWDRAAVS